MGDVVFLGALRAPVEDRGSISVMQLASRARQAADRIESDAEVIRKLAQERDKLLEIAQEAMGWDWLSQAEDDDIEGNPDGKFSVLPMQELVDDLERIKSARTPVPDEVVAEGSTPWRWKLVPPQSQETEAMVDAAVKVFEDAGVSVDLGWLGEACRAYVAAAPEVCRTNVPVQWIEAVEEFVRKVDNGQARSTKSYNAFKALLSEIPGHPAGDQKTYQTSEEEK